MRYKPYYCLSETWGTYRCSRCGSLFCKVIKSASLSRLREKWTCGRALVQIPDEPTNANTLLKPDFLQEVTVSAVPETTPASSILSHQSVVGLNGNHLVIQLTDSPIKSCPCGHSRETLLLLTYSVFMFPSFSFQVLNRQKFHENNHIEMGDFVVLVK